MAGLSLVTPHHSVENLSCGIAPLANLLHSSVNHSIQPFARLKITGGHGTGLSTSFLSRTNAQGRASVTRGWLGPQHSVRRKAKAVTSVLKESQSLEMGTRAPDFQLVEPLSGKMWQLDDFEGYRALLVIFMCNHCPFVVHIKRELVALTNLYAQKGLGIVAISSNSVISHPQDGPEMMAKEAKQFGYVFPYLYDETQEVAKAYKAACTPDFYVFKKDGRRPFELAYHGQLDDSRPSNGVPVTGRDLRSALNSVMAGIAVPVRSQRPSIGCNIKWAPGNEPDYF
eukprot:TRINITY_DN38678_c0_g1_i1.p1 TRINITY_DN38678_c0_g1~~TRINITY_DN38678_c0_g1_i1.p1  ORF type:complete len:284 (+),score=21.18 TRINITY_DN38678_c0_g1_i1:100-951(+)